MTEREAQLELKERGWVRKATQHYVPPAKMRGVPRHGLTFMEACSFAGITVTNFIRRRNRYEASNG